MELETLLVFLSGIYTKKISASATLIKDSKVKLSSQGLTTFNVQQVDIFILFSVLSRKGYYGMHTNRKSKDVSIH